MTHSWRCFDRRLSAEDRDNNAKDERITLRERKLITAILHGPEGASVWDKVWNGDPYARAQTRVRRAARRIREFGITNDITGHWLDVGCGDGETLAQLSRLAGPSLALTGVDFSSRALALAHRKVGDVAELNCADARSLPFADGVFTHVSLFGVLEHSSHYELVLSEASRVLRPGGRAFITTSNKRSALQIINAVKSRIGRYAYGLQRNFSLHEMQFLTGASLETDRVFVVQSDSDMKHVRAIDQLFDRWLGGWGRYIFVEATKKGNVG
jgi:SAM-dependent methyltransferase